MRRALLAALLLTVAADCATSTRGADIQVSAQRGVLLLGNGQLIEGTITASGDRYDVVRADREIRIRRSQVEFVGRDADECYRHKRSKIDPGRIQDYLDLAEWCLRNNLPDAADKEIAAGKTVDPTHPKIPLLEARLKLARDEAQAPKESKPAVAATNKPQREPADAVVRNLPAGCVETFTNHIQPLLLNYCARAGCHGPQSTGTVRLERIPPNRNAGRKSTQRNLQSILSLIDRAQPDQSKLLTVPVRPHGPVARAVFTDREQSQYRQLVQWVYQVGEARMPAAPPKIDQRESSLLERGPQDDTPPPESSSWADQFPDQQGTFTSEAAGKARQRTAKTPQAGGSPIEPAGAEPPAGANSLAEPAPRGVAEAPAQAQRLPADFVPRDAFDPELFNRRFLKP